MEECLLNVSMVRPLTHDRYELSLDCPCNANCPNGCQNCRNPICPVDNKSVLVLNTKDSNQPVLIKFDGEFSKNFYGQFLR